MLNPQPPAQQIASQRARDESYMRAALSLARRGLGRTAPNPSVAALVVRADGAIIGRGITADGGHPHAEFLALQQAGAAAKGAELYVTLEPCGARSAPNRGRSCTDEIIASRIARVIIACEDTSPFAAQSGIKRLKAAGILVEEGVLQEDARALNIGHFSRIEKHRPFVQLKLAQTADGFAALRDAEEGGAEPTKIPAKRLLITGAEAQTYTHCLRAQADAIMVGSETILRDDPQLNCRIAGLENRAPQVMVLDRRLRIPLTARILNTKSAPAKQPVIFTAPQQMNSEKAKALRENGAEILAFQSIPEMLAQLSARGITRLMLEGGPSLAASFAEADMLDEINLITAPHKISPAPATGVFALNPALTQHVHERFCTKKTRFLGIDRLETFERIA